MNCIRRKALFAILIGMFLSPPLLRADRVMLKNGQVHFGKIIGQSRKTITLQKKGKRQTFKKIKIRRVDYGMRPPEPVVPEEKKPDQKPHPEEKQPDNRKSLPLTTDLILKSEYQSQTPENQDLRRYLGEMRFGLGIAYHFTTRSTMDLESTPLIPGTLSPFRRDLQSADRPGLRLWLEQEVIWDFIFITIGGGFVYRQEKMAPRQMEAYGDITDNYQFYQSIEGYEYYLNPGFGMRFLLTEDLAISPQLTWRAGVLRTDHRQFLPEVRQTGLLEPVFESNPLLWRAYRFHNISYGGAELRLAVDWQLLRVWVSRVWTQGPGGDARFNRDEWVVGTGVVF